MWGWILGSCFDRSASRLMIAALCAGALLVVSGCGDSGGGGGGSANQAPTAAFTASATSGDAPLAVAFDGSASTDADGTIAVYAWDFGDGGTASGATPSHTYTATDVYTVTLTVTDDDGATHSITTTVTVTAAPINQAPTAAFTASATSGEAPLAVTFDASGSADPDGTIAGYTWDFGDGGTDTGVNASHTFLTTGDHTVTLTVTDDDGATHSITTTVTVTAAPINQAPTAAFTASATSGDAPLAVAFDGSASTDADGTIAVYAWDFGDGGTASGATPSHTYTATGDHTVTLTVTDDGGATDTAAATISVTGVAIPPDPAAVAPEVATTVPASVYETTSFLYAGADPIQTGVADGTMERRRAAVLRGLVTDRDGAPLPGVAVTVLDHPEFGQTLTRGDGMFDLAVNGGGLLTVNYAKAGYLTVQRQLNAPWNDFAWLPDVVLVAVSAESTALDLSSTEAIQVAQGPVVTDDRGTRRSTILVPQGTSAQMVMPDGSTRPFASSTLTVRATEYTVGDNGPQAMPGELPPGVGYTYAVELSVDEAEAAGAASVQFGQTLYHYVDNFIGFPAGEPVPVYYYDRQAARWVSSEPGVVIEILDTAGGTAAVDADGDGLAEDAAALVALGMSDAERGRLAQLYAAGDTLWRAPLTHFSPHDLNWLTAEERPDPQFNVTEHNSLNGGCTSSGSIVECQDQVLGERLPVTGTPFTLNYRSSRVPGRSVDNGFSIQITKARGMPGLESVRVEVTVAGRRTVETLPGAPNLTYDYEWDGLDAYGRPLPGRHAAHIRLGYTILSPYQCGGGGGSGAACPPAEPQTYWFDLAASVGTLDARAVGLGGWTLSPQQTYDPARGELHQGDGRSRRAQFQVPTSITYVAGNGVYDDFSGDGGPANQAGFATPRDVAVAPDGSYYIADTENHRIRRVDPDGIVTTVAGGGSPADGIGDGLPATQGALYRPAALALGSDGSLYIADTDHHRIRKVGVDGIITTIAGSVWGFEGDGGPAAASKFAYPRGLEVGPDGSVYIADSENARVRKIDPRGIITTIAGTGTSGYAGDDGPAVDAQLSRPRAVALGPDGSLYVADFYNHQVRRISPLGTITTVVGNGIRGASGDGGPAVEAEISHPQGLVVAPDGVLYVSCQRVGRGAVSLIRRVSSTGTITTLNTGRTFSMDDGAAGLDLAPDGSLYVAGADDWDEDYSGVHRLGPVLPGDAWGTTLIASDERDEVYTFEEGRHIATLSALTGATLYDLGYDADGHLVTITDADGNVTTVARDGAGNPTAIVAPGGQRTELTLDYNGFLASIENPAAETWQFSYTVDGLLTRSTGPNGGDSLYTYDDGGRLVENADPAGGGQSLAREEIDSGHQVTRTTAEGVEFVYATQWYDDEILLNNSGCCGTISTSLGVDGVRTMTRPDGSTVTTTTSTDHRFKDQAPYTGSVRVETPGGQVLESRRLRYNTLSDLSDPLSLTKTEETVQVKLQNTPEQWATYRRVHPIASGKDTLTTPEWRTAITTYDGRGRVVERQTADLAPVALTYDAQGRIDSVTRSAGAETRTYAFTYRTDGTLAAVTDPGGAAVAFTQDAAGRVTTMALPGTRTVNLAYDANGNLTALTSPNGQVHAFTYTGVNLPASYTPPAVSGAGATAYTWNRDRKLTRVARPDGMDVDFTYGAAGRLSSVTAGTEVLAFTYSPFTDHVQSITAPDGSTVTFGNDGPLPMFAEWSGVVAGRVAFEYDPRFLLSSTTVGGVTVGYTYDRDGLLTGAGDLVVTRGATNGLVSGTTLGTVTETRSYSAFGEAAGTAVTAGTTPLYDVAYTRDPLGRVTRKTETVDGTSHTHDYTYDAAGRLASVTVDGAATPEESYIYDANGNRTGVTNGAGTVSATFDAQDRLLTQGAVSFTYTANGELATRTEGTETTAYTYDPFGNLRAVDLPAGTGVAYVVDGLNRRIGKKVNGALTRGFLYRDQLNPIAELDGAGNVVSRFVYGTRSNVPEYMTNGGATYRIVADHLGSVRLVVNAADGTIAQRLDYDAYGRVLADTNPGFQPFGFAGGLYDPDTGLVRFGYRDYDPAAGRWTAKDPIFFAGGSANLYEYVSGGVTNRIDPYGLYTSAISIPIPTDAMDAAVGIVQNLITQSHTGVPQSVADDVAGAAINIIGVAAGVAAVAAAGAETIAVTAVAGIAIGTFNAASALTNAAMNAVQYVTGYDPSNILSDLLLDDDDLTSSCP